MTTRARKARTMAIDGQMTEKQVEHLADRIMQSCGFEIVRFSMPRATMQTPGIPDRRYYHPTRKMAVWYEAKRPGGKQSLTQKDFESMVTNCGEEYIVGTDDAVVAWLRSKGIIE